MSEAIIDTNSNLSRWPTRRLPLDVTAKLVAKFVEHNVTQAWVGTFDGLLHKDLASANARLAEECRAQKNVTMIPFGSINLSLPAWEDDLRRCTEQWHMPGIRLHPNYHGYNLDDPKFVQLLRLAAEMRLLVTLAATMEDERTMHPLLRVAEVDLSPLPNIVAKIPGLKLILLNAVANRTLRGERLHNLLRSAEVYVEIAMFEGIGGVAKLLSQVPVERVLFGSHSPAFYFESSLLKLSESTLTAGQLRAIQRDNAQRLLASTQG